MCGIAARIVNIVPRRHTFITKSQVSSLISQIGSSLLIPALLNRMSMLPNFSIVAGDRVVDLLAIGDIDADARDLAPELLAELLGSLGCAARMRVGYDDVGAFLEEAHCDGAPDADSGTGGDQSDFVF